MRSVLLEVALETAADALAAETGGADRLEVCAALDLGGLTPTPGQVEAIRAQSQKPMVLMLRPRGGDFVYSLAEWRQLLRDQSILATYQPVGWVVGGLTPDGAIDEPGLKDVLAAAQGIPVVFHRAFDRTANTRDALETLIELGVARILTSGGQTTALAGAPRIAKLIQLAENKIQILPCGRIREKDAVEVLRLTGATQLHGSFARPCPERPEVGFRGYPSRYETSAAEILATREAIQRYQAENR